MTEKERGSVAMGDIKQKECQCFGDSGLHASTYIPVGSDREHCDLCGYPVPDESADVLSSLSRPVQEPVAEDQTQNLWPATAAYIAEFGIPGWAKPSAADTAWMEHISLAASVLSDILHDQRNGADVDALAKHIAFAIQTGVEQGVSTAKGKE